MIELLDFVTEDGRNPFREWLKGLKDREARARIRIRLNRVRLGNFGDSKSVGHGVHELRIPHGPGYRIYLGRHGDKVVILLHGGDKGSQARDIVLAQTRWAEYRRRSE